MIWRWFVREYSATYFWQTLKKKASQNGYIKIIQDIYKGPQHVRTACKRWHFSLLWDSAFFHGYEQHNDNHANRKEKPIKSLDWILRKDLANCGVTENKVSNRLKHRRNWHMQPQTHGIKHHRQWGCLYFAPNSQMQPQTHCIKHHRQWGCIYFAPNSHMQPQTHGIKLHRQWERLYFAPQSFLFPIARMHAWTQS